MTARVPRTNCPNTGCGIKHVVVPWSRAGSGVTLLFEALLMTLVNAIAQLLQVHHTRLWPIIRSYVDAARATEDFSGVTRSGVDKTSTRR